MITILNEQKGENELFVLSDGKDKLAECEYSFVKAEILEINAFCENSDVFCESVLRAALSRLDFSGKTDVISKNPNLCEFLTKIGFEYKDGIGKINTTEFFKKSNCK